MGRICEWIVLDFHGFQIKMPPEAIGLPDTTYQSKETFDTAQSTRQMSGRPLPAVHQTSFTLDGKQSECQIRGQTCLREQTNTSSQFGLFARLVFPNPILAVFVALLLSTVITEGHFQLFSS